MKNTCIVITFISLIFISCNDWPKAGNRRRLIDLPITRNVDQDLILRYIDTFNSHKQSPFALPEGYDFLSYGGVLQYFPGNNKITYFKNYPVEAYHLSSSGVFLLCQVFNPLKSGEWISEKTALSNEDYNRIERRLDTLFTEVVKAAKADGVADSNIFWKAPYDKVVCKLKRP